MDLTQHECQRCGRTWRSRSDAPDSCPGCGSYKWDEPTTVELVCVICGVTYERRPSAHGNESSICGSYRCQSQFQTRKRNRRGVFI